MGVRAKAKRRLQSANRAYPAVKIWLAILLVGFGIGLMVMTQVGRTPRDEWQESTEAEIERQLMAASEVLQVADTGVSEMPSMEMTARQRQLAGKKLVALTFDDGPGLETGRLLDILAEKNARATFFVLGMMAERGPMVVARMVAEGHEVGNHTMNHKNFGVIDRGTMEWEIGHSREVIAGITGGEVKYIRPPGGVVTDAVRAAGPVILWSVDPRDWRDRNTGVVQERVVSAVYDGAIVLMHDIYGTTIDAVPGIIDSLRGMGYEMVTLGELFAAKGWEAMSGVEYRNIGG